VMFYSYGTLEPEFVDGTVNRFLTKLAHLPGDPFERLIPFFPAFLVLYCWPPVGAAEMDRRAYSAASSSGSS
jgi:hypothetical protein